MSGLLILMALGAIAVMAFGHRIGAQPALLILVAAAGVSFVPGLPRFALEPELILGVVVPPLLYAAALEFSLFSFVRNLRSILGLGVVLVLVTALVTGYVTAWLLPAGGLGVAFVLAAIVAPPDTVTIAAHGERYGLPRRVSAILTGESLVNDAAALTLFSVVVASVAGTDTFIANPMLLFGYSAGVGLLVGIALGGVAVVARSRLGDPTLETAIGIVLPFGTFFAAEHIHASGVLAVVAAGFTVSVNSAFDQGGRQVGYRTRLKEGEIWPVIGSLLEAFVFVYTGVQLRFVLEEFGSSGEPVTRTVLTGLVVLTVVIVVRLAWILVLFGRGVLKLRLWQWRLEHATDEILRLVRRRRERRQTRGRQQTAPLEPLGWKESVLVGWTGVRGIVTLGAAGGIPLVTADGSPFPHRPTIQFLAYLIVIGTLLIQGPTLRPLARLLRFDGSAEDREAAAELATARRIVATAGGSFAHRRQALTTAVAERRVDDEAGRELLESIDRHEAAASSEPLTPDPGEPAA